MKAQIYQHFIPHLEVYFTHEGKKYSFHGTELVAGGALHTIKNTKTGNVKSVPHSVLDRIVDFETKPLLTK
jgi:hypothetical protein